jgi:FMN phosphatase YigB (HAD superfamily)
MAQRSPVIDEIRNYKGVIFDLDETLVDLCVNWDELKNELSKYCKEKLGVDILFTPLDKQLLYCKDTYDQDLYNQLIKIITRFELEEKNYRFNVPLIEYVPINQKSAIYSMNTMPTIQNIIKKYLKYQPDIIISKETCIEPKPTDKDLLHIIQSWQLDKKDVVYIGNSHYNDAQSGNMAGIKTLIINF